MDVALALDALRIALERSDMGLAMTIITNSGIRGYLPRTICLICLTLMWMETALGLCLGCQIHGLLVRRGGATRDPDVEVCANGACDVP